VVIRGIVRRDVTIDNVTVIKDLPYVSATPLAMRSNSGGSALRR